MNYLVTVRKKASLASFLWVISYSFLASQPTPYNFSFHEEPYESLSNPELLSLVGYAPSPNMFYKKVPLGFSFNIDHTAFDSTIVKVSSPTIAWSTPKNCFSGLSYGITTIFSFGCRQSFDTLSTTEVRYKTEGLEPHRIFKLEYFQLGFKNYEGQINVQIWLYEGSDSIQIRIGQLDLPNIPNLYLTGLKGPLIGFQAAYYGIFDSDDADFSQMVNGTPDSPGNVAFLCPSSPVGFGIWYQTMDGAPKYGSVFTFYPNIMSPVETPVLHSNLLVYPNPSVGYIQISGIPFDGDTQIIDLFNSIGGGVKRLTISKEHPIVDTQNLPLGVYYLSGKNDKSVFTGKFIISE